MEEQNNNQSELSKNKNKTLILGIIILLILLIGIGVISIINYQRKQNETIHQNEIVEEEENSVENIEQEEVNKSSEETEQQINQLFQVKINNNIINFPCTKEDFKKVGWEFDSDKGKNQIAPNNSTTGGRIGSYPGGVVITVINKTNKTQNIEDCDIISGDFYNPGDGSENVYFIGELNYTSTIEEVRSKMISLGYNNVKEKTYETAVYLKYYLDDNQSNSRDYIEFYFNKDNIKMISISTSN